MKENEIKIRLIDYLLDCRTDERMIVGSEVRFFFGSRRADIVALTENSAIAYEIKGESDNTERLAYQIDSYKKYFDSCYIVCEPSNLEAVRRVSPKSVGILVANQNCIRLIRKPYRHKRLDKRLLLDTVSIQVLKGLGTQLTGLTKSEICNTLAKRMPLDTARSISRENLYKKLKPNFVTFCKDKGQAMNSDDLWILSRMPPSELRK